MSTGIWIKVDAAFARHKKVMLAGSRLGEFQTGRVIAIWLEAMCYIHETHTEGFLPRHVVSRFVHDRTPLDVAAAMASPVSDAEASLWGFAVSEDDPESRRVLWFEVPGGWRVHDYDDYQGKAVEIVRKRKESGRLGGKASGAARRARRFEANASSKNNEQLNLIGQSPQSRPDVQIEAHAKTLGNLEIEANASSKTEANASTKNEALACKNASKTEANSNPGTGTCTTTTRTAPLTRREFPQAVSNTKGQKSSTWKRAVAIAHAVMEQTDRLDWTEEFKDRCARQRIDYGEIREGRPLFARVLEYVEHLRAQRGRVPSATAQKARTAPAAPGVCVTPTEDSKPATTWKRAVAIAHRVMDEIPDRRDWEEAFKVICAKQRIDYAERNSEGRPLYARAMDYAIEVRARRVG